MTRLVVQAKVGRDGILHLELPVGLAEAEQLVRVTVEPAGPQAFSPDGWRNFIQSTAGSIDDPTFERGAQGDYEERERLG